MKTSPLDRRKILIVTGESSGDQLGEALALSIRARRPDVAIHGVGGPRMEAAALDGFLSSGTAHATGATEILRHLPAYLALLREILKRIRSLRPDAIVLVDNPGFNLRLAKKLASSGIPVVGYVSPQVWAWKEGRTRLMSRVYREVLTLFDFEEPFLEARGVRAKWVGHPIAEAWPEAPVRAASGGVGRILLLPGSRPHEVRLLLPVMLQAAMRIQRKHPGIRWSLLESNGLPRTLYDAMIGPYGTLGLERHRTKTHELFWGSDFAFACSGTVTLECALAGLPTVLGYRASAVTAILARWFLKVKWLGMPNLLAGKELMPELLQERFTAENLEHAALEWIEHADRLSQNRAELAAIRAHLGPSGSSDRAAAQILSLLD